MMDTIRETLLNMQDTEYQAFQCRLIPGLPPEQIIGVRTPTLRSYAKELRHAPETETFLATLPHHYFEENQLHSFLIAGYTDITQACAAVNRFLPYIDNWATCDQLSPKAFRKEPDALLRHIPKWLNSTHPYTVRFGIKMLMDHFLETRFSPQYLAWVAAVESEEYYINMMISWYFATALAKQWEATLPFFQTHQLAPFLHKKSIQKAIESFRIPNERKLLLRTLR